jgi:hypothetical protein
MQGNIAAVLQLQPTYSELDIIGRSRKVSSSHKPCTVIVLCIRNVGHDSIDEERCIGEGALGS